MSLLALAVLAVIAIIAMYRAGLFNSQDKPLPLTRPLEVNYAEVVPSEGEEFLRLPVRISPLVFPEGVPPSLTLRIELGTELNRDWFIKRVTGYLVGDGPGDQMLMDNFSHNVPPDEESRQYQVDVDLWKLQPDATYLLHVDVHARQPITDSRGAVARIGEGGAVIARAEWTAAQDR